MVHVVQNGDHTHKGVSPNTEDHHLRAQDTLVIRTGEPPGALLIVEEEVIQIMHKMCCHLELFL